MNLIPFACRREPGRHEVNDPGGSFILRGFPERYVPGETYELELTLSRKSSIAAAARRRRRADGTA
jgi:hypothetical protein